MTTNSEKIDFSRLAFEIKSHKRLFVISFVVVMGLAVFYLLKTPPQYASHAQVLIESPDGGNTSGGVLQMVRSFTMGSLGGGSVDDEAVVMQSFSLFAETAHNLGLNYEYRENRGLRKVSVYRKNPLEISSDINPDTITLAYNFELKMRGDGKIDVDVKDGLFSSAFSAEALSLPAKIKTPAGVFTIKRTAFYNAADERTINVTLWNTTELFEDMVKRMSIAVTSMKANAIDLYYEDDDRQRAHDLLNTMIEVFNNRRLSEEKIKAESEISFINNRLNVLTQELEESEKRLEEFKTENDIADIETEAKVLIEQTAANKINIVQLQTQLAVYDMICEFLENPGNSYSTIPLATGVDNQGAAKAIEQYNNLILQRLQLTASAKPDNRALATLNAQIDAMRSGVIATMRKAREGSQIAYNDFYREDGKYASRLRQMPKFERAFIDLYRDKEIKNNLYIFLLEQRESNALKFGASAIGRIIDPAFDEVKKVGPKGSIVLGVGLILSLLIPFVVCALRASKKKKLMIPSDVNALSIIPLVAEPIDGDNGALAARKLANHLLENDDIKVLGVATCHGGSAAEFVASLTKALEDTQVGVCVVDFSGELHADLSFADCLRSDKLNGASVTVDASDNMMPLIMGESFAEFISMAKSNFRIVILNGNDWDAYSALNAVAHHSDRIIALVNKGALRSDFSTLDAELIKLKLPCGYAFYNEK